MPNQSNCLFPPHLHQIIFAIPLKIALNFVVKLWERNEYRTQKLFQSLEHIQFFILGVFLAS